MQARPLPGPVPQRPDIAGSWRRARQAGLHPSTSLERLDQAEVDLGSRLVVASAPVLDRLAEQLRGTRYCVLLADRDARIVQRRSGAMADDAGLDRISAVPGTLFDEASTGTNSIATVHELRRGVRVVGDEHFVEAMRSFTCYGHPIQNPLTRRLEGVLDISGPVEDTNDLLAPYLTAAAEEIERRLLLGARAAQQHLLAAFQTATSQTSCAVLVLGEGVCLSNPAATVTLAPEDHVLLRALADDGRPDAAGCRVTLASGQEAELRLSRVSGGGDGVLVKVAPVASRPVDRRKAPRTPADVAHLLVVGEPGSGRSTQAFAECSAPVVVDALDGDEHGVDVVRAALAEGADVVVENAHAYEGVHLARLRQVVARADRGRLVATGDHQAGGGEWAAFRSAFARVRELPPLRERKAELPELTRALLQQLEPEAPRRPAPELLDLLLSQPWPGNLHELRGVLRDVLASTSSATLTSAHLPPAYRRRDAGRTRTPLEQSERATIVAALTACGGNKVATARQLGISRVTLYSRIRSLGIVA